MRLLGKLGRDCPVALCRTAGGLAPFEFVDKPACILYTLVGLFVRKNGDKPELTPVERLYDRLPSHKQVQRFVRYYHGGQKGQ